MAQSIADLAVTLSADTGKFRTDMGRAAREADKNAKRMAASFQRVGHAAGVYLGKEIVRAIGYMTTAMKSGIDRADELYNAAQKIGVSVEALSGLEYAAKQAGVGLEELQGGLARMVKFQAAAAQGNDTAVETFKAFGIALKDSSGQLRDSEALLKDWAAVFEQLPDGATKTALAMRVFGKSGAELIPFLNEGAQGIADLIAEAERLGLVISTDTGKRADEFNDSLDRLKGTMVGVATQIATELLPDLQRMADQLQSTAEKGTEMGAIRTVFEFIGDAASIAKGAIDGFTLAFIGLYNQAQALFQLTPPGWLMGKLTGWDGLGQNVDEAGTAFDALSSVFSDNAATGKAPAKPRTFRRKGRSDLSGDATVNAANALMGTDTSEDAKKASKAAAAARKAAADAAREQAERERELARAVEEAQRATEEFNRSAEDQAAQLAGPLAQATLEHTRRLQELDALKLKGNITDAQLAEAKRVETALYDKEVAAIQNRLDVGGNLLKDLEFEKSLIGMGNAERLTAIQTRGWEIDQINKYRDAVLDANSAGLEAQKQHEQMVSAMDGFRSHFEDAFASILDGSKSIKDAFKDLASSILADIARMLARKWVEQLFGAAGTTQTGSAGGGIMSLLSSFFGSANGNAFINGSAVTAFANGGIVSGPTLFPMRGGVGLMGELDDEAVMPIKRLRNGKLGVHASGGSTTVNVMVNGDLTKKTGHQAAMEAARAVNRARRSM